MENLTPHLSWIIGGVIALGILACLIDLFGERNEAAKNRQREREWRDLADSNNDNG